MSEQFSIFFGAASDVEARVYAQCEVENRSGLTLGGTIRGPHCRYAQTLPATVAFRDLGPGPSLLAEAVVPDPCFWTPELPFTYAVEVQLRQGGAVIAQAERLLGVRPLATAGRNLVLQSRRWVVRGVGREQHDRAALAEWRDAGAAMLVADPDDKLCREASLAGVLLVAQLTGNELAAELNRLSRWPAVGIAVLDHGSAAMDRAAAPRNLLLAERFAADQRIEPSPWAQLMVCEVDEPAELARRVADCPLPVIAFARAPSTSLSAARAECDELQRRLAPFGDYAGYLVSSQGGHERT